VRVAASLSLFLARQSPPRSLPMGPMQLLASISDVRDQHQPEKIRSFPPTPKTCQEQNLIIFP
jgi:hypothetical protein